MSSEEKIMDGNKIKNVPVISEAKLRLMSQFSIKIYVGKAPPNHRLMMMGHIARTHFFGRAQTIGSIPFAAAWATFRKTLDLGAILRAPPKTVLAWIWKQPRYRMTFGEIRGIVVKIPIWLFSFLPLLISITVISYENKKPILKVETHLKTWNHYVGTT